MHPLFGPFLPPNPYSFKYAYISWVNWDLSLGMLSTLLSSDENFRWEITSQSLMPKNTETLSKFDYIHISRWLCCLGLIVAINIGKFEVGVSFQEWAALKSCHSGLHRKYRTTNADVNKIYSTGPLHSHKDTWKLLWMTEYIY